MSGAGPEPVPEPPSAGAVRLRVVHLGGVRSVAPGERDLELRFSELGISLQRVGDHALLGSLSWDEVAAVRLPRRGPRLRPGPPRLTLETRRGRARFLLPGLRPAQVRDHLAPLLARRPGSGAA